VPHTVSVSTLDVIAQAYQAYASLMHFAPASDDPNLGGRLLYAGDLDESGRALAMAANIAGAATLAASSEPTALRQAQREGAIDFLVNSLDEALRILKNEIRKREPVAVAVSAAWNVIETEMIERGVLPDLLPPQSAAAMQLSSHAIFVSHGAQHISAPKQSAQRLLIWAAPAEYSRNLAGFESIIAEHLPPNDHLNRRWLRLSARYLGPAARQLRSVACTDETATALIELVGQPLNG
jgi:hypothetical protein